MKYGTTLAELAGEIDRQNSAKIDLVADTPALTITSNGASTLTVGDAGEFGVTDHFHGQVADRLKIPKRFYDRLKADHPDLLDGTVNELFKREPEKRLVRTLDGRARAFLSNRYRILDNLDLMQFILPTIRDMPGGANIVSTGLTESRMYLKVELPDMEAEIPGGLRSASGLRKVGDTLRYGFMLSNSEIGAGALTVAPYSITLDCTNGMTHAEFGTKKYHLGGRLTDEEETFRVFRDETIEAADRAFFLKVRDVVQAVASETVFDQIVAQFHGAAELKIEGDVPATVEAVTKRFDLTETEGSAMLRNLIEGGDLSALGMAQAITRTASDVESYDRASELERVGGKVIELERKDWLAIAA